MCEWVVEHTGDNSDDTTRKEAWLCVASKRTLSEFEEFEKNF